MVEQIVFEHGRTCGRKIISSIVAFTYPVDKKDFRFLPQILNSKS
jgi:hypothetical protein